jgi:outer membrane receptor for ferrienterochelin and colicins
MKHGFLLFMVMAYFSSQAQTIKGIVRDEGSKDPLPHCVVMWKNTRAGTITDGTGQFFLGRVPGVDTLSISFAGYKTQDVVVKDAQPLEIFLTVQDRNALNIHEHTESLHMHGKDPQRFQTITEKELCKAACCNLSESFETNASVDGSYTDGVTGTRQIKMLGLDGKYAQIMTEGIGDIRGLSTVYGLAWVPGPWIREISISKGAGSILPGYESMAGQINIAHKGSEMKEKVFLNLYAGNQGRYELNTVSRHQVSEDVDWQLLTHAALNNGQTDMNKDGFLDNAVGHEYNGRWQMSVEKENGFRGDYNAQYINYNSTSGNWLWNSIQPVRIQGTQERWSTQLKSGWILPTEREQSLGSQISYSDHLSNVTQSLGRNYQGRHRNVRISLLHQMEWNEEIKWVYGVCGFEDRFVESLSDFANWSRKEVVMGPFAEFTWNTHEIFQAVLGARWDQHNLYGSFFSPRAHLRYSLNENTHVKVMSGLGRRTANVIMDQPGIMASNRVIQISQNQNSKGPLGLPMEEAWNSGVVITQKANWFHRSASWSVDAFITQFRQQVVIDWDQAGFLNVYSLHGRHGKSQSRTVQFEANCAPVKRMELRVAYRYVDAFVDYETGRRELPFVSKHRVFTNLSYTTKLFARDKRLLWDFTAKWNDTQRLPMTSDLSQDIQMPERSPAFWIINGQVSLAREEKWDIYVGVENIFNFQQKRVVIYSNGGDPETTVFDANFAYAPAFGRMTYIGLRWRLGGAE